MYGVKRVVIGMVVSYSFVNLASFDFNSSPGENENFVGGEEYLKQRGIEVVVLQNDECQTLMKKFITEKPSDWNEDIGEEHK